MAFNRGTKAAENRLLKMTDTEYVAAKLRSEIHTYFDTSNTLPIHEPLSTIIHDLQDCREDSAEALTMLCQSILWAVANIQAQNTRDLVTLVRTLAPKK
jgi:hypothetical protein